MVQEDFAKAFDETRAEVEGTTDTGPVQKVLVCKGCERRGRGDDGVDKLFDSFDVHGVVLLSCVNEENEKLGWVLLWDVKETEKV